MLESHVKIGQFQTEEHPSTKRTNQETCCYCKGHVDSFTDADAAIGISHLFGVKGSPKDERSDKSPLGVSDLLGTHGLELLGVIDVLLLRGVINEVGIVGVPVGEEIKWLIFESYEHS